MLNCFTEMNWLRKLVLVLALTTRAMARSTSKPKSSRSCKTFANLKLSLCSGQSNWMYNAVSEPVSKATCSSSDSGFSNLLQDQSTCRACLVCTKNL